MRGINFVSSLRLLILKYVALGRTLAARIFLSNSPPHQRETSWLLASPFHNVFKYNLSLARVVTE